MIIEDTNVDMLGTNVNHLQVGETQSLTNSPVSQIIIPAYGAFFTESLVVKNKLTGKALIRDVHYTIKTTNQRACLLTGKEVADFFIIIDKSITDIFYNYQWLGGGFSNGKYLLQILESIYPNGIKPSYEFENILGRPDFYPSVKHEHSAYDTYGYDYVNAQLDRIINATNMGDKNTIQIAYTQISNLLTDEEIKTANDVGVVRDSLYSTFEALRVQNGEYIFTDSPEDPYITRKYGVWKLVKNTVLSGASSDLIVGDGTVLLAGSGQFLRNTYIWLNEDNVTTPTYKLSVLGATVTNGIAQVDEEVELTIQLQTTGVKTGTKIAWVIEGISDEYLDSSFNNGAAFATFVTDSLGQATATIKFKNNPDVVGSRTANFRLENIYNIVLPLLINDNVRAKGVDAYFSHDQAGLTKATTINEGVQVYLQLTFNGYNVGENIYLDWSASGIKNYDLDVVPPSYLTVSTNKIALLVKVKDNLVIDGTRALIVYVKSSPDDSVSSADSMAVVQVADAQTGVNINLYICDLSGNEITSIDEGANFLVKLVTDLPEGEVIDLTYNSTKNLTEFQNLLASVTVDANGVASFFANNTPDYLTSIGAQILTVSASYNGNKYSEASVIIRDTSATPNYSLTFTKPNSTDPITSINEGDTFWVRIKVANWINAAYPPLLLFSYGLNGNMTANSGLTSRISGGFYSQLEFGSNAANNDGVYWNTGELILELSAIADHAFSSVANFSIAFKQSNMATNILSADLPINDTSVLDVSTAWSSSALSLNPITQVNEMTASGQDNLAYLWLQVSGDGSLFGDIILEASGSSSAADFSPPTVFPQTIKFDSGATKKIIAVTFKADFLTEGNESLMVTGSYINASGVKTKLFDSTIIIVDNSVKTPIDVVLSTSPTDPTKTPVDGKFSEYYNLYAHVTLPAYLANTTLTWALTGNTGQSAAAQYTTLGGTVAIASGVTKTVLTLSPIADGIADGEFPSLLTLSRKLDSNNVVIGDGTKAFTLLDDSKPTSIETKFYSDAARTTEAFIFNEGATIYGRTVVMNSVAGYYLLNNIITKNTVVTGGYTYLGYADSPVITYADQGVVKAVLPNSTDGTPIIIDFVIQSNKDRLTAAAPQLLRFASMLIPNTANFKVGDVDPNTLYDVNYQQSLKTLTINDTSQTATYAVAALGANNAQISNVNEGVDFKIALNIANGEVGDVFTLSKNNAFDASVLEVNQLGVDQVQSIKNDSIIWNLRVALNRNTNNYGALGLDVINKTTGKIVGSVSITINDIYKTPVITVKYVSLNNGVFSYPTSIQEGGLGNCYFLVYGDANLLTDETIHISRVSGRASSNFTPSTNFNKEFPVLNYSGNSLVPPELQTFKGAIIPIVPTADKTTNTATDLTAVIKAVTSITGVEQSFTLGITDSSQTRSFNSVSWNLVSDGSVLSSVNEGQEIELRVVAGGGTDSVAILLENNGGRSIARLDSNEYGVTKTRTSNSQVLAWRFKISNDLLDNTGADTMMNVKLTFVDSPTITRTISLPINDTSRPNTGLISYLKASDNSAITSTYEGDTFIAKFRVLNPTLGHSYRFLNTSARTTGGWALDVAVTATATDVANGYVEQTYQLSTALDATTNTADQLYITSQIFDLTDSSRLIGSNQLSIIDMSREAVTATNLRIVNPTDLTLTHLTTVNEGSTVKLYFAPVCFANTDWLTRKFLWEIVGATTTPQSGYITQNSLAGDGSYSINTAIPADETTNGNRDIYIKFSEVYIPSGVTAMRGKSAVTNVKDTSPLPSIDSIYYALDSAGKYPVVNNVGKDVYLIVTATGLTADGSDAVVDLSWSGDTTVFDTNVTPPTKVTVSLTDPVTRKYQGSTLIDLQNNYVPSTVICLFDNTNNVLGGAYYPSKQMVTSGATTPTFIADDTSHYWRHNYTTTLYDLFVLKTGRSPVNGENVLFILNDFYLAYDSNGNLNTISTAPGYKTVLTSPDPNIPVLAVGNSWLPSNGLTLYNEAMIYGCGGHGGYWNGTAYVPPTDGGIAIAGGNVSLVVNNHGVIAGGGGGGDASYSADKTYIAAGGGGCPLGIGGASRIPSGTKTDGGNGIFTTIGTAGKSGTYTGSVGGAIGSNGGGVNGGKAGKSVTGQIIVNNINGGTIL